MNEYPVFRGKDVVLYDNYVVSLRRKLDAQCRFYLPLRYLSAEWRLQKNYSIATIKGLNRIVVFMSDYVEIKEKLNLSVIDVANNHGNRRISVPLRMRGHLPGKAKIIIEIYNDRFFLIKRDA